MKHNFTPKKISKCTPECYKLNYLKILLSYVKLFSKLLIVPITLYISFWVLHICRTYLHS